MFVSAAQLTRPWSRPELEDGWTRSPTNHGSSATVDLVFDIRAIVSVVRLLYRNRRFLVLTAAAHPARADRE